MTLLLALTAVLLYIGCAGTMAVRALRGESYRPVAPAMIAAAMIALACHAAICYRLLFVSGGLNLSFFAVATTIAWFIGLIALFGSLRAPIDKLLVPVYGLAALTLFGALAWPGGEGSHNPISPGVASHILFSILAYAVMTLAAFQAVTLSVQNHELKARHIRGVLNALPPLQTMETLLFEILWVGMVLLTLSILSGMIFLDDIFAQHLAHKTFFAIIAWMIFAMLLWGRYQLGWRGLTAIRWTLGGFAVLMLAYFGSKFVLELILQR
jgi:ABC-type uncharacterized transport system permease subunit